MLIRLSFVFLLFSSIGCARGLNAFLPIPELDSPNPVAMREAAQNLQQSQQQRRENDMQTQRMVVDLIGNNNRQYQTSKTQGTDFKCLNDCTKAGYIYNYCHQACSYNY